MQPPSDHDPTSAPPFTASRMPPPPTHPPPPGVTEAIAWLRAEVEAGPPRPRQARLLGEIGEIEERCGDEPGAARDYLAAFNADPTFREPLEGLVRLLERRRSFRNLGKVIDAFVKSSKKPEEAGRALLMKAAFAADVSNDLDAACDVALLATRAVTSGPESALACLTLEVLSGKTGDLQSRAGALASRVTHTEHATWRALLLLDLGRLAVERGDVDGALDFFRQAQTLGGAATYSATIAIARLIRHAPGDAGSDESSARLTLYATVLRDRAGLVRDAISDGTRGDQLGVPHWARHRAHMADAWLRSAETLVSLGEATAAGRVLDEALQTLEGTAEGGGFTRTALTSARMHVAELAKDDELAARLAEELLAREKDVRMASPLALRVAENVLRRGDPARAEEALTKALRADPSCIATRALQLDLLMASENTLRLMEELDAYVDRLETTEARARMSLIVAMLAGAEGKDVAKAKAALAKAAKLAPDAGVAAVPGVTARLGRLIAAVRDDALFREEATNELLSTGALPEEYADLWFEVIRSRFARGADADAHAALPALAEVPHGAWLASALGAFLPASNSSDVLPRSQALDSLAELQSDPRRAGAIALLSAARAHHEGDSDGARRRLRALLEAAPANLLATTYLADLERAAGSRVGAASAASRAAAVAEDADLAAALHLEAGLDRWRGADRKGAIESFEMAAAVNAEAAKPLLRWASRGVGLDTLEGTRLAIERAGVAGEDPLPLALERFATELDGGDQDEADRALDALDLESEGALQVAGDLARIAWGRSSAPVAATLTALGRLEDLGPVPRVAAAAERFRWMQQRGAEHHVDELASAARAWFDAGGGLGAALEWLAAALGTPEEVSATRAVASLFQGEARDTLLASAALLAVRGGGAAAILHGDTDAVALANLELSPPGSDVARRAAALERADTALGAGGDAAALAGWARLAAGDVQEAMRAFQRAVEANADDLAAWGGLHAAARVADDKAGRAVSSAALGERCTDNARGAAFWEEAGLLLLELGDGERAEVALEASFQRDPSRSVAFDRLFRRVRERKEGDKLLALISRRLEFTDDPTEIVKLYWERSRVLREKGDVDGALAALENVTMVEPDHVGALALSGEIFIRRGQYAEAAEALGRLAKNPEAPPKNRATAGIAAVDLYENKLDRSDLGLEVLMALHAANLTTMPVRERLARAAAKTGSWQEAANILEELMVERPSGPSRIEAAQLAMAIRRDRLADRAGAQKAMVKLLEEDPAHGDAIDLLLDAPPNGTRERLLVAARTGLVTTLAKEAPLGPVVRRLARVAHELGDSALEHTCLAAAAVLGSLDEPGRAALARLSSSKPRFPQIALTENLQRTVVAEGDGGPVGDLFALLGPTLAEALGPTVALMGVGRRERVDPRAGSPVRQEVAAWAGALGLQEFELYVGGKDPVGVQGVPGEPHSLVIGAAIAAPFPLSARARVAREVFALARGTTVLRLRDETTVLAIVVSACKLAEVAYESPAYAVQAEIDRLLSKAIARKTRKLLPEVCLRIVQARVDVRAWSQRAIATLDRMAAVATGDVGVVLSDIVGQPTDRLADVIHGDRRAEALLHFALSPGYLDVRRALGLEGAS